jgi:hypothetical protein
MPSGGFVFVGAGLAPARLLLPDCLCLHTGDRSGWATATRSLRSGRFAGVAPTGTNG